MIRAICGGPRKTVTALARASWAEKELFGPSTSLFRHPWCPHPGDKEPGAEGGARAGKATHPETLGQEGKPALSCQIIFPQKQCRPRLGGTLLRAGRWIITFLFDSLLGFWL